MTVKWLVPEQNRYPTPNKYQGAVGSTWKVQPIELIVLHFTVGYSAEGSAKFLADMLKNKDGSTMRSKASSHFVVSRNGGILQLASLEERCWHAGSKTGSSRWRGMPVNPISIGIEMANLGPLFLKNGKWVDYWGRRFDKPVYPNPYPLGDDARSKIIKDWCKRVGVNPPKTTNGAPFEGLAWEPFTSWQVQSVEWLCETLAALYPVLRYQDEKDGEQSRIAAHSDVDPGRKLDSGPAFQIQNLRELIQRR